MLHLCVKCLSLFYYLSMQNIDLLLTINLVSNHHTVYTDLCIYTLKEFIDYYKSRGTTLYRPITFLDANKAFDRIDHWLLFNKMIKKGAPLFIIKLLVFLVLTTENVCTLG